MSESTPDSRQKQQLLDDSEHLVDLIYALEEAIERNDEGTSKALITEMDGLGGKLVDLIPALKGDDLAYAQFMLGSLCSALRMWPEAEKAYRLALDHWPDHVGILNELFTCLMQVEKYDEARKMLERSMEAGGETPELLQHYAAVQVRLDNIAGAKITLINCMARYPEDNHTKELMQEIENHYG